LWQDPEKQNEKVLGSFTKKVKIQIEKVGAIPQNCITSHKNFRSRFTKENTSFHTGYSLFTTTKDFPYPHTQSWVN